MCPLSHLDLDPRHFCHHTPPILPCMLACSKYVDINLSSAAHMCKNSGILEKELGTFDEMEYINEIKQNNQVSNDV